MISYPWCLQVTAFDNTVSSKFLLESDLTPTNIEVITLLRLTFHNREIST